MLSSIEPPILTLLVGVISFSMVTNHKQTCVIHFVDCRKALHSYFTHHTRKYFGCERRRGLHGGRHVVARVDVWGLLARPAGRWDWPAENYPVRTSRVMRKAGAARRRLACGETGVMLRRVTQELYRELLLYIGYLWLWISTYPQSGLSRTNGGPEQTRTAPCTDIVVFWGILSERSKYA